MPSGVFVWRDEFEPMYRRKYLSGKPFYEGASDEQMPHDERAEMVALDFDPYISDDELHIVMEGFLPDEAATQPLPAPDTQAGQVAPVVESPASEPKAKRTTAFNDVLPYLQEVHRNGKFKTTDEFIRELGKQSGEGDSPFKKAARTDVTFYLKDGGKSVSHSRIADTMKSIR